MTFVYIWLATVIISYFLLRLSFKSMNKWDKEQAPIGYLIIVMFIPLFNLIFGIAMFMIFGVEIDKIDKIKFINKIFFIKE